MNKLNKINEAAIVEKWSPAIEKLTEGAVSMKGNPEKMKWMCEYAHNHTMAINEDVNSWGGLSNPLATPYNTYGIGNPVTPQTVGQTAAEQNARTSYGSGDKFTNLLPMSLQVAARTIGFDLLNTKPLAGPTGVLPFTDYVYSGSKDPFGAPPSYSAETANPKYNAAGATTKEAYLFYELPNAFRADVSTLAAGTKASAFAALTESADKVLIGNGTVAVACEYIGKSRLTAEPMFKVLRNDASTTALSLGAIFKTPASVTVSTLDASNAATVSTTFTVKNPRLISMLEDQILGYTGSGKYDTDKWSGTFVDGTVMYDPMDRATGEQQWARQLSLRVFTRVFTVGTVQVKVGVTQEQVADLQKQWGIDVLKMVQNAAVNELSQSINKHILSRLFALGWVNHLQVNEAEGINLNLKLDSTYTTGTKENTPAYAYYVPMYSEVAADSPAQYLNASMEIPYYETYGAFENRDTVLKRVFNNILTAGNVIMNRGRRGPANFVVTNYAVATALQTNSQYSFAPWTNTISQNNGSLYPLGTVAGMTVYVDPNMQGSDTRVLVGRKGAAEEPGVCFCPYLMAESATTISEANFAPVVLVKSRYSLVDLGFYPQTQYLTFYIGGNLL